MGSVLKMSLVSRIYNLTYQFFLFFFDSAMYVVCLNCEKVNNVHRPTRHWALVEILF